MGFKGDLTLDCCVSVCVCVSLQVLPLEWICPSWEARRGGRTVAGASLETVEAAGNDQQVIWQLGMRSSIPEVAGSGGDQRCDLVRPKSSAGWHLLPRSTIDDSLNANVYNQTPVCLRFI